MLVHTVHVCDGEEASNLRRAAQSSLRNLNSFMKSTHAEKNSLTLQRKIDTIGLSKEYDSQKPLITD